ncbi:Uncharacterized protein yehS [Beauveria bassiana D1-5]|uniref:Uncharacterized protein yehS n=1 Tax=Beauveria bassiana D1-5 TaxID=1245745 RepID=A0A0A2W6A0_BEABA|nr:Uncharacterized protein yehS [Beauveria bassiana D1-5]
MPARTRAGKFTLYFLQKRLSRPRSLIFRADEQVVQKVILYPNGSEADTVTVFFCYPDAFILRRAVKVFELPGAAVEPGPGLTASLKIKGTVRYMLNLNNDGIVKILALTGTDVPAEQIVPWLKKEDEEGFKACPDLIMANFLNGLIYFKRGKDESKPEPKLERRMTNNIILKKLRIAFELKSDDVLEILTAQQFRISMPEITAMMRNPDHKNYRECGDQFLRYFLRGLTQRLKPAKAE